MGIMAQIGIVLAVCLVGEGIAALLPIPFPASVISMVLLFLLLAAKLLRPHHIKEKSNFLITNMACFFLDPAPDLERADAQHDAEQRRGGDSLNHDGPPFSEWRAW